MKHWAAHSKKVISWHVIFWKEIPKFLKKCWINVTSSDHGINCMDGIIMVVWYHDTCPLILNIHDTNIQTLPRETGHVCIFDRLLSTYLGIYVNIAMLKKSHFWMNLFLIWKPQILMAHVLSIESCISLTHQITSLAINWKSLQMKVPIQ